MDVLLAGHLDARLLALQADGTLSHPQQQLAFASTLATRGENKVLQAYLASHHPRFDDESEEKTGCSCFPATVRIRSRRLKIMMLSSQPTAGMSRVPPSLPH